MPALAAARSTPGHAEVSPPDVNFQVLEETDAAQHGGPLNVVLSITNRSDLPLDNLQLHTYPDDSKLHFSLPALGAIPAFGSQHVAVKGTVDAAAEFQTYHAVFVLQYNWKVGATPYSSTQNATVSVQVNRRFEDEAKGLPGGTAALLYLILPIMTIFLAYQLVDSLRKGKPVIPEFKSAHIAAAFLFAILFNFLLIFEWRTDQSYLYATPRRFAGFLLLLAAGGALIPLIRWAIQVYRGLRYTFRSKDTKEKYLKKALHQLETGAVSWTKAKVGGVDWEGARLRQPNGRGILGACLQISAKTAGKPTREELKQAVDERGIIADRKKLLKYLKSGNVVLDFKKRISRSGTQMGELFVENQDMTFADEGATPETIVRFV